MIVSALNTAFEIAEITSNTIYYFELSVFVNGTLLIRNRFTDESVSSEYHAIYIADIYLLIFTVSGPRFSAVVIVFLALTISLITVGTAFGIGNFNV